jgi:hypothetical protein
MSGRKGKKAHIAPAGEVMLKLTESAQSLREKEAVGKQ